jgi:hypothetical protein
MSALPGNLSDNRSALMRILTICCLSILLTCIYAPDAASEDYEAYWRDFSWNEMGMYVKARWLQSSVDTATFRDWGILEWDIDVAPGGKAYINGWVGRRFTYEGFEDTTWVEVLFNYDGWLQCSWWGQYACTLSTELYEGNELLKSVTAIRQDHDCDDCSYDWEGRKDFKAVIFPCWLVPGNEYTILLRVKTRAEAPTIISSAESDFKDGTRYLDLQEIRIWNSDKKIDLFYFRSGHPNSNDRTAVGEYVIEQKPYEKADGLSLQSYNKDAKINAYRVIVHKFDTVDHHGFVGDLTFDVDVSGNTILNKNTVYVNIKQWIKRKNSMGLRYYWREATDGAPVLRQGPISIPDHYWSIDYPEPHEGRFKHRFRMDNDGGVLGDSLRVNALAFLASMDSVEYISSLDFTGPFYDFDLDAFQSWSFDIITDEPMIGGYIYFRYSLSDVTDDSLVSVCWGGHEICVDDALMYGDPGIYEGFPEGLFLATPGVTEIFPITLRNFADISGSCTGPDTFGVFAYDTKGWIVAGSPPLGTAHILAPGETWAQSITVLPPSNATASDTDTVIVAVTYCDSTGYLPPVFIDCENPNPYLGTDYYSADTLVIVFPVGTGTEDMPGADYLAQNYPNPFNPTTKISYGIREGSRVSLRIYDVAGRLVRVLVEERRDAGHHTELWDGRDNRGVSVASGVYFYRLVAGDFVSTKKLVLLR